MTANRTTSVILIFITGTILAACKTSQEAIEQIVIDPVELQNFADSFFVERMEALHISGLVFIFVQGDEVIYAKGYGYANLETKTPINEELSIIRIGSVSKSIVATGVMQLVEQGNLDLDTDINRYLTSFHLENTFSDPVTLSTLLTHTGGFEDPPYASNPDPEKVRPLGEFLARNMPSPTHPPGEVFIYSNYGYALAALVVEEVTGVPFYRYVQENIFKPLEMNQSKYLLAPPLPENMTTGYFYEDGVQIPQPMDYDSDYPGGSIVSTAEDMSHFIRAHLQGGCYQENCILQAETVAEMHQRQASTPYEGQHVAIGFVEGESDGVRILGHSGAIRGFGSNMDFFPESEMGYFFSFNAECHQTSACQIVSEFRREFMERFFQ